MTLTNYWWQLIWVVAGGGFLAMGFPKKSEIVFGKMEQRWQMLPAILLVVPLIIWAGFRGMSYGDTYAYKLMFAHAPSVLGDIPEYLQGAAKDKGFSLLMAVFKCIFGDNVKLFFLFAATFQMLCVALVLRKYSSNYWFSIFVFVASTGYMSWVHNGLRQFIAVAMIFAASDLLFKKKYVPLIIIILIAYTMHASAIIMIPIIFIVQGKAWNKKTLFFIAIAVLALLFVDLFTNVLDSTLSDTQYTNVVSDWQSWGGIDDGTNPIRVLVYSVPAILSLVGLKVMKEKNNHIINIASNASIITMGLALISMGTSGIFLGRLPIFVELYAFGIALPWQIDNIFSKETSRIIYAAAVVCYTIFFYYQMHFVWGLL